MRILKEARPEFSRRVLRGVCAALFVKNNGSWYLRLEGFEAPDSIQSGEHSTDSGVEGRRYEKRGLRCQRQLEPRQPEVERQHVATRQQVECRQLVRLPKLRSFSPDVTSGEFSQANPYATHLSCVRVRVFALIVRCTCFLEAHATPTQHAKGI